MRRVIVLLFVAACGGATATMPSDGGADGGDEAGSSSGDASRPLRLEDLQTCAAPGECVIDAPGCCGFNCQPDGQLIAVHSGTEQQVIAATCNASTPVACPGCQRQLDPQIQPFCRAGKCSVVDLRTDAISSCMTDDDCELRYATCCQPCNGGVVSQIVAIAKSGEGELTLQLCTGSETCAKCLPSFPGTTYAHCNTSNHHCQVDTK